MGDALAVCLMEKKGFTKEDFLMFHPSGKLGKGLTYKVKDLMITGDKMPIVNSEDSFTSVIKSISSHLNQVQRMMSMMLLFGKSVSQRK